MMQHCTTLIERWASQCGLSFTPGSPRLTLSIDERYRVHLTQAPGRRVSIEARICDLPVNSLERERLIESAMLIAATRMHTDACVLAVDELESELLLQAEVSENSDEMCLSNAIGSFVNSLAFWQGVV